MDFKAAGLWKHACLENSNALLLYLYFEGDPGEHRQRSNQKAD